VCPSSLPSYSPPKPEPRLQQQAKQTHRTVITIDGTLGRTTEPAQKTRRYRQLAFATAPRFFSQRHPRIHWYVSRPYSTTQTDIVPRKRQSETRAKRTPRSTSLKNIGSCLRGPLVAPWCLKHLRDPKLFPDRFPTPVLAWVSPHASLIRLSKVSSLPQASVAHRTTTHDSLPADSWMTARTKSPRNREITQRAGECR
jgi:hypothetical protein